MSTQYPDLLLAKRREAERQEAERSAANAWSQHSSSRSRRTSSGDGSGLGELFGGIGTMAIAVVWFGVGLMAGYIFFYPPILFLIGLCAAFRGLFRMMT